MHNGNKHATLEMYWYRLLYGMHGISLMPTERMGVASTFEDQNEGLGAFHCNEIVNTANEGQCIETP